MPKAPALPDSLRLGPLAIATRRGPEAEAYLATLDGDRAGTAAAYDAARARVCIAEGLEPQVVAIVVVHELIHAMVDLSGVMLTEDQEEGLAMSLSGQLVDLIRDNPALVDFIRATAL